MPDKKTVLVTGGAGGVDSAICRLFASKGYAVVVTYNSNAAKAQALADSLAGNGHMALHAPVDDAVALAKMTETVKQRFRIIIK